MTADADGNDPILDALQDRFGGMVVEYVVVANIIDDDGDSRLGVDSFENQRCHTTLGLLSWALAVEKFTVMRAWSEDDA